MHSEQSSPDAATSGSVQDSESAEFRWGNGGGVLPGELITHLPQMKHVQLHSHHG
eukprot:CAMPEP_0197923936 /NCGR_PEP_ID=MMETSP1439-20131203/94848_1 /TAXON_ID=66791 /ORGANISM="Gonyaulax spinifera, Strain CCMP409" /LENGTH=54 /DNA_ID=CAMNT_0043546331 /DNA_START=58 /DNA_END=218 /DNA_ORIENTATION=-